MAIQSFGDRATEAFFVTGQALPGIGWSSVRAVVRRKLDMIHYAFKLSDLKSPPGNRLETQRGKLEGSYSIRVNDPWRVVFDWTAKGPSRVRVADYH